MKLAILIAAVLWSVSLATAEPYRVSPLLEKIQAENRLRPAPVLMPIDAEPRYDFDWSSPPPRGEINETVVMSLWQQREMRLEMELLRKKVAELEAELAAVAK